MTWPLAGPVFEEWYWGLFFILLIFGPVLAFLAAGVTYVAHRIARSKGRRLKSIPAFWLMSLFVIGSLWMLGDAIGNEMAFQDVVDRSLPRIHFETFEPPEPPEGMSLLRAAPAAFGDEAYLWFTYRGDGAYLTLIEQPMPQALLGPDLCNVEGLSGVGTTYYEGPCVGHGSQTGEPVFLTPAETLGGSRSAFQERDGTLLHVRFAGLTDGEIVAYLESLRPVATQDIDYFTSLDY